MRPNSGPRMCASESRMILPRRNGLPDNLSTHTGASLYKTFEPEIARRLLAKLEFVYTPKHGSWLNMAECEFSVLSRQCLNRRLPDIKAVRREVTAWTDSRNQAGNTVDWRFTTEDARIKLKTLYPCTGKDQTVMDIAC